MNSIELLKEIRMEFDKGNTHLFEATLEKCKAKYELPEELKNIINGLPDNPIEEEGKKIKERLESFENIEDKIDIIEDFLEESDDYSVKDLVEFLLQLEDKVLSYKNEDGTYKKTPNTENARLLKRKEFKDIKKKMIEINNLEQKDANKASEEIMAMSIKYSGLEEKNLEDWEKNLVLNMVMESVADTWTHIVGKQLKR